MWSSWTSASTAAPDAPAVSTATPVATVAAPSPSATSVADALASSSYALATLSHRIVHRLRCVPRSHMYTAAATATTVAVAVTGVTLLRSSRRAGGSSGVVPHSSALRDAKANADPVEGSRVDGDGAAASAAAAAAAGKAGTDDNADDIDFADPAESAFLAYVLRVKRQKEAPLMAALAEMQACAEELEGLRHRQQHLTLDGSEGSAGNSASTRQDESVGDEGSATEAEDDAIAKSKSRLERLAVVSDELLTQWVCSLDGVPVRQSEVLKQRRKALVQEATALTARIMPYLPRVNK